MLLDLKQLIKTYNLKITGVIHIGANTGQEVPLYEQLGIRDIILIEPCTEAFTELYNQYSGKHIIHNVAISDFDGETEMFITDQHTGQSNSLLKPALHEQYYPEIVFDKKETVCVRKLDSIYYLEDRFNCMVIDVQGAELSVLRGAENSLKHINYLLAEVNKEELYEGCTMVADLDNHLSEFIRVKTKWIRKGWGEALYIRKTLL